jgi:hypothetical protein
MLMLSRSRLRVGLYALSVELRACEMVLRKLLERLNMIVQRGVKWFKGSLESRQAAVFNVRKYPIQAMHGRDIGGCKWGAHIVIAMQFASSPALSVTLAPRLSS